MKRRYRTGSVVTVLMLITGMIPVAANVVAVDADAFEAHLQNQDNLKQLALAMHNYHDVYSVFPAPAIESSGTAALSWRVSLLPFLGYESLFNQFDLSQPWDAPANTALLSQMPAVFRSPADPSGTQTTRYVVGTGPNTIFAGPSGVNVNSITDGTSNTLLIGESANGVPWTKPEDIPVTNDPAPTLPAAGFGSITPGGVPFAFADGSVKFLSIGIDPQLLRDLFLRNDRHVIPELPIVAVQVAPDSGFTAALLGLAMAGFAGLRNRLRR